MAFRDRVDPALVELSPLGPFASAGYGDPKKLEEALLYYLDHPVDWVRDNLGATPDDWQAEVLNAIRDDHFVAVRSGHGVGKSALEAWSVLWFLCTHPFSKVLTTANTKEQLFDVVWAEAKSWIDRSGFLQQFVEWQKDKIIVKSNPEAWFAMARTAEVRRLGKTGITAAEGLQGRHAQENILILVDEASGVDEAVFTALEGALTAENSYMLIAGNPTRPSGYFYDAFHTRRSMWKTFVINAEDSPRARRGPFIARALEFCNGNRDDPYYLVKVRGEFPPEGRNSVYSLIDIEACMPPNLSDVVAGPYDPYELGVDVAVFGDAKTAISIKHGPVIEAIDTYARADTMETCGRVVQYIHKYRPTAVKIDVIGVGRGVYDRLRELGYRECIPITSGAPPSPLGSRDYLNLRAEGHWRVRQLLERRQIRLPKDEDLASQMSAINWKPTSSGKIQIESKDELHSRGVKSPDKLDALVLSCHQQATIVHQRARVINLPFMSR